MKKKRLLLNRGGKVMQNIEQIYEQYCNTVYKYLFCLTHNEDITEDLTQRNFCHSSKRN